ncbi:hypothetical protein TorRG33x02_322690 [Trema orientale]|uniref:Secreted protein n=1 Tax=Trema orientale TaxID=63057 RepID=A0A2P5BFS4_TREOI|nr:hypothetical protein TorRG33x02_322690 [Trema orientale]
MTAGHVLLATFTCAHVTLPCGRAKEVNEIGAVTLTSHGGWPMNHEVGGVPHNILSVVHRLCTTASPLKSFLVSIGSETPQWNQKTHSRWVLLSSKVVSLFLSSFICTHIISHERLLLPLPLLLCSQKALKLEIM